MSEKKTTSKKVHTLTLEDQTKLAQANVKKMEQGKIEVMKVVEGVQGAEKLAELIERGKKNGKLSSSELMDVLENLDLESDQMDKIYDTLENLGIDTVGDDYLPELADDIMPPLEELNEIEELPEEEMVDPNTLVDSFGIDDPVRMLPASTSRRISASMASCRAGDRAASGSSNRYSPFPPSRLCSRAKKLSP